MRTKWKHRICYQVIKIDLTKDKEIVQIDKKLPKHFDELTSISLHVVPSSHLDKAIPQCGELSLSINNVQETILHTTTLFSNELSSKKDQSFPINAQLYANNRLSGYYRDFGFMKNDSREFIPHSVKIIMECKKLVGHE